MVRLRSLEREAAGVEIWAKLDWLNPGGSVKDRAGLFIVQDGIERGLVGPGRTRTLIDSTSGNTGIAYAWLGAALGVPVALVMPGNVSEARKQLTRAYGAQQIFSDPLEQSDGAIRLCRARVAKEPERWFAGEGLVGGHSAGAAPGGAWRFARELAGAGRPGVVVTLFPDRADRYLPPGEAP